jgi:gamma-glutamylcyclotransferase (GGCT)/AIG2-like uncharacterized protein YtfP
VDAFVYGTLCSAARAREVLGHASFGPDARLVGLQRTEARYPTLAPGGQTGGRILRVDGIDLEVLDGYEGVDRGLYVRVLLPSDEGEFWTYVGNPDALGADVEWPGDGSLKTRVERYVERHDVRIEV